MRNILTVLAGALLFLWPAVLNGYPILFSDTAAFLQQALIPYMFWDKPWVYGPFLTPFHARITLWPGILAQASILSALLWLLLLSLTGLPPCAVRRDHLVLCLLLAATTAAPWFASTLMPDIFAPIAVLGLVLLGTARLERAALAFVAVVTTLAIAVHLTHLVLAAACLAALSLLCRRVMWRQAAPLAAALLLLLGSNLVGHGVLAVSPYGSVFALARLVADGPAADTIRRDCPAAGWHVCAWSDHLPADSDDFLWDPAGPVWGAGSDPIALAPEAAVILRRTLLAEPGAVLRAALRNTAAQLVQATVGDTLVADQMENYVRPQLLAYFPAAEVARFDAGQQAQGRLAGLAAPFNAFYSAMLAAGAAGTALVVVRCWRRRRQLAVLGGVVLVAVLANAAATGALSHPHDRYQARIAWLVVLAPALALAVRSRRDDLLPPRPAGGGSSAR